MKELFVSDRKGYFYTTEMYNHYVSMYDFLKEHGLNNDFQFVCIDIEHDPETAFKEMNKILAKYNAAELLRLFEGYQELFDKLDIGREKDLSKLSMMSEEIKIEIEHSDMDELDRFSLVHMMDNLMNYLTVGKMASRDRNEYNKRRDEIMYSNFVALRDRYPNARYFGNLDWAHVFQKDYNDTNWLGCYLSEDEKVVSFIIRYKNSRKMDKKHVKQNYLRMLSDPLNLMSDYRDHPIYFFNLDKDDSPFKENLMFVKSDPNDNTTDYFQYMFLVNGGRASEPYNKKIY